MAHIELTAGLPGIRGLMAFRPETAKPLNLLVDILLRSSEGLTPGERELIATYVSYLNDCFYCQTTHGAVASAHFAGDESIVTKTKSNPATAPISKKMKALLAVAAQVQRGGKSVTPEVVAESRAEGATDLEIHDTVLIAAAFCMYNRYVDGLGTWSHQDMSLYRSRGEQVAQEGYTQANLELMRAR